MDAPYNRHGGLTLVPMPGFESWAKLLKIEIEERGTRESERPTPVDIVNPNFGVRSSGEPFIRLGKHHIGGHDCMVLGSGPGTSDMLIKLIFLLRYLKGRHAARIATFFGYFPLGRSDKDEGDQEFALPPLIIDAMMCMTYNQLDRIISMDLHAPQVVMSGRTGIITEVSMLRRLLQTAIKDASANGMKLCLAFPDSTAFKRAEKPLRKIQKEYEISLPAVYGLKDRISSEEIKSLTLLGQVEAVKGARVLSIDDEIATFNTNVTSAGQLKKDYGAAEVWSVVTHGVFCGPAAERLSDPDCPVDRIYVTDSIPFESRKHLQPLITQEKIRVIPILVDLAWIVYNHHWDESIRVVR
ncbi:hypothetical protein KKG19_00335 [Patescibacteria group bacterium]|nr:hypothetical protein [Patescibacteria group bacterium]